LLHHQLLKNREPPHRKAETEQQHNIERELPPLPAADSQHIPDLGAETDQAQMLQQ
jgi:hypothetical protein